VHKKGTHGVEFSTENITFLHYCHGSQQAKGAEFWILAYLCSVLRTWEECLSCFCITKIMYSYQYWFTIGFSSPWFCITKINTPISTGLQSGSVRLGFVSQR